MLSSDSLGSGAHGTYGGWETTDSVGGATVSGLVEDGPAAKAGLAAGDVIAKLGSHTVTSAEEVSDVLADYDAGNELEITWTDSSGDSHSATITLAASPVA